MTPAEPGGGKTVIFLHLPKTGGLTLRHVLARHFPPAAVWAPNTANRNREEHLRYINEGGADPILTRQVPDPERRDVGLLAGVAKEQRDRLRLVQGHFRFGVHAALDQPSTYVTLVRDPVERVLSLYHHRRIRHGLTLTLAEYTSTGRDNGLHNTQTRLLAGWGRARSGPQVPPQALEAAKANLERHFAVVGVTDRYDETLLLLKRRLGFNRIFYMRQKVSEGRVRRSEAPPDVVAAIKECNLLDEELYAFARGLMEQAVVDSPGLADEVAEFRRRNAVYGTVMRRAVTRVPATAALRVRARVRRARTRLARHS